VDSNGVYTAQWEVPLDAPAGEYDIVVTANHHTLTSSPFTVVASTALVLASAPNGQVHVGYPAATENVDVTARPASVGGGTFRNHSFSGALLTASTVPAGAVQDSYGNCNGSAYGESGTVTTCPESGANASVATTGTSIGNASLQTLPNTSSLQPAGALAGVAVAFLGLALRRSRRRSSRR
jgi:hypothetical protein